MNYYINTTIKENIETATIIVANELQKEGFGIVTQFDVNKALKEKLNVDFRPYRIMGACNPAFALKSMMAEDKIGTILPCNVLLQEIEEGTEIAIINPVAMVSEIDNNAMKLIAEQINNKMNNVINNLNYQKLC